MDNDCRRGPVDGDELTRAREIVEAAGLTFEEAGTAFLAAAVVLTGTSSMRDGQ
jgi:hypothetical protein